MKLNLEPIATVSGQLKEISDHGLKIQDSPYEIATAIGTLLAVFVALFAVFWPSLTRRWNKPKLSLEFDNREPFCRRTTGVIDIGSRQRVNLNSYHARLRVKNTGRSLARRCEGKMIAIAHKDLGTLRQDFDPVVLHWVGSDTVVRNLGGIANSVQYSKTPNIDINAKEYEYLDLISTNQNTDRFEIQAIDYDIPRGITLDPQRDDYFILITLYAENADPISEIYKITNGANFDDFKLSIASKSEQKKLYKLIK